MYIHIILINNIFPGKYCDKPVTADDLKSCNSTDLGCFFGFCFIYKVYSIFMRQSCFLDRRYRPDTTNWWIYCHIHLLCLNVWFTAKCWLFSFLWYSFECLPFCILNTSFTFVALFSWSCSIYRLCIHITFQLQHELPHDYRRYYWTNAEVTRVLKPFSYKHLVLCCLNHNLPMIRSLFIQNEIGFLFQITTAV